MALFLLDNGSQKDITLFFNLQEKRRKFDSQRMEAQEMENDMVCTSDFTVLLLLTESQSCGRATVVMFGRAVVASWDHTQTIPIDSHAQNRQSLKC